MLRFFCNFVFQEGEVLIKLSIIHANDNSVKSILRTCANEEKFNEVNNIFITFGFTLTESFELYSATASRASKYPDVRETNC